MRFGKLALGLTGLAVGYALTRASSPQIPQGIVPVKPFDLTRYLGKWYEIGRLENRFERGLTRTTAEYSLNPDQTVKWSIAASIHGKRVGHKPQESLALCDLPMKAR